MTVTSPRRVDPQALDRARAVDDPEKVAGIDADIPLADARASQVERRLRGRVDLYICRSG